MKNKSPTDEAENPLHRQAREIAKVWDATVLAPFNFFFAYAMLFASAGKKATHDEA